MNIPVIDISPYLHGREKQDVARQIGQACIEIGFFTIRGHGIPLAMIQQTNEAARIFFDGAVADKRRFQQPGGMGYIGSDGENLAASLDDKQVQDVKESLNLTLPIDKAIWPSFPPQLRLLGQRYYTAVLQLSHHLMRLFALALGLPENWFDDKVDQPRTILRLLNYPPIPAAATSQTRAGAHTDYGTLTILWSPDSRGLQVQTHSGNWVDVVAPADHFIINIGDLMMNWTNDRWRSTLHRVVPHPDTVGQRRQSMAFFHNPNPDALIECIATCTDAHNAPHYAPILAKTHLEMKIAKSLGQSIKL